MKKALAGLIAAGLSLVVALGVAELALRLSIGRLPMAYVMYLHNDLKDRLPSAWTRIRAMVPLLNDRQEDADVGWTNKPRQPRVATNEDGEPFSTISSDEGFFTSPLQDRSARQIVTLGASFLCTYYVREPIQYVIQRELGVPVYNLAAGSWGPENYRAAYEKFATPHPHDLVVVFSVLTDPGNAVNWRDWKAEGSPESYMTWMQKQAAATDSVNHHRSWADTHLMTWNLVRFAMRSTPAGGGGGQASAAVLPAQAVGREHFNAPSGGFDLQLSRKQDFTEKDPEDFLPGGSLYPLMQEYFESMVRLKSAIEARHARMVLVWIPSKERIYIPLLPKATQTTYVTNQSGRIDGLENAVSKFAQLEGISFLDLTEPLFARARAGEKLYFTVDGHWNSNGAEAAGNLVSDFIRSLPAPPAPRRIEPRLYYRRGQLNADRRLTSSAMTYRAAIVSGKGNAWTIKGKVESRFSYLAGWKDEIDEPQWLLAKGVLRHGGLTFGVLQNDKWSTLMNVSTPGRFDVALPVMPGRYSVLIANNVASGTPDNDAEITSFGWAPMERDR